MLKRAMGYDADGLSCALCGLSPDRLSRGQDGPSAGRGRVHACVCFLGKGGEEGSVHQQDGPSLARAGRTVSRTDRQALVRTDQVLVLISIPPSLSLSLPP